MSVEESKANYDFKGAVINALVVNCIYRKEHDEDAQLAVAELVAYETKLALDPSVSSEAAALQVVPPAVARKVASVLLALEDRRRTAREFDRAVQYVLDDPEVATWLVGCRRRGFGDANVFTTGRAY